MPYKFTKNPNRWAKIRNGPNKNHGDNKTQKNRTIDRTNTHQTASDQKDSCHHQTLQFFSTHHALSFIINIIYNDKGKGLKKPLYFHVTLFLYGKVQRLESDQNSQYLDAHHGHDY